MTRQERIADVNYLILQISMFGRRFFYSEKHNRVAKFEQTMDGKLWFRDDYTDKRIYVAYKGRWRHFSHGGTLKRLVEDLAKYIRTGEPIGPGHFGPWPDYICGDGDLWGYGLETMTMLRNIIRPRKCVAHRPRKYVIVDLRQEWKWRPYISFWRPNNANYAYPLVWAGDYTEGEVIMGGAYYTTTEDGELIRFAVERHVAETLGVAPEPGHIDGNTGPVVLNNPENIRILREAAFRPLILTMEHAA